MVVLKEGQSFLRDETAQVQLTTKIDAADTSLVSQLGSKTAWNSFALAVNGKPTIEPLQIGVTVTNSREPVTPTGPEPPGTPGTPVTPVTPNPDPGTDLPEEEIPLTPAPGEEPPVEIIDDAPPLADKTIPQTGDNSATALFALLAVLSATGLAVLSFGAKKKERDSN